MDLDILYIIGTSHSFQCGGDRCTVAQAHAFEQELITVCKTHNIAQIAEEISADAKPDFGVDFTIGEKVAKSLAIRHAELDLTRAERKSLSIEDLRCPAQMAFNRVVQDTQRLHSAAENLRSEVRERIWIARLICQRAWPTLLILGADHVETFQAKWCTFGVSAKVIHADYAPPPE